MSHTVGKIIFVKVIATAKVSWWCMILLHPLDSEGHYLLLRWSD